MTLTQTPCAAAFLVAVAVFAYPVAARAKCNCPSGSESIAVGQETKADSCDLQILLHEVDRGVLRSDVYHVFVKSDQVFSAAMAGKPTDYPILQNGSVSLPAGVCGALFIGAHRAPEKGYIELNWSYF